MLLKICELILSILSNLLILLNKNKDKDKSKTISGYDLKEVIKELRRIEEDRKRSIGDTSSNDSMKADLKELNERLKNIESVLYEKKTNLLKEKIVNNNSKEKGG